MKMQFHTRNWFLQFAIGIASSATLLAATNVPPTVVISNAVQRPGTTFMDIDFRVDDPDDATVQVAALAFINGGINFSDIVKINTLVEGTETNIGTNVTANTPLRLTWNVAADWNTNFGNAQVEILAKDARGLMPFHWITLPSNGPNPEITINHKSISDADLLPIWYWLLATSDPAISLVNGQVIGVGGRYDSLPLAQGTASTRFGRELIYEKLNVRALTPTEVMRAKAGRYGFQSVDSYSVAKGFVMPDRLFGWGQTNYGKLNFLSNVAQKVSAVALGQDFTLLLSDGTLMAWGNNQNGQANVPTGLTNVIAVAAGGSHSLALRSDGTVIAWGLNNNGQANVPNGLSNVVAVAAGGSYSLALRNDGTVVAWGDNNYGQTNVPTGLSNVVAVAAGGWHSLALRSDGTVMAWGYNNNGQTNVPTGLTNVTAVAAGGSHSLALRNDGTVVAWGDNYYGQTNVPTGLSNVVAVAAGRYHSLALRNDGTVIAWGNNQYGQTNVPPYVRSIDLLGIGCGANHVVVVDKQQGP